MNKNKLKTLSLAAAISSAAFSIFCLTYHLDISLIAFPIALIITGACYFTGYYKLFTKNELKYISIFQEVLQYLPVNEKNNLIEVVLQKANEGSIFNTFTMDMYFHLYLIMYYTNLTFTEKQREDLPKLYDAFEESGFINMFLNNMNRDEYVLLKHSLEEMKDITISYNNSTKKIFDVFQEYAPNTADKVSQELKDFDIDKYEQVINIARAAGAQF